MQAQQEAIPIERPYPDVLLLLMNRPVSMNAITTRMGLDMPEVFGMLVAHPDRCRAVI